MNAESASNENKRNSKRSANGAKGTMIMKTNLEEFVDLFLDEENDFEALLEYFDITVYEALECLFENGLVDEELLEDFLGHE